MTTITGSPPALQGDLDEDNDDVLPRDLLPIRTDIYNSADWKRRLGVTISVTFG